MTDSSANSRNYGEHPLHEDDPLMELSRIMDFGASADTNIAQSDRGDGYRAEPDFDSGESDLSFDLERELLGDFGDEAQPQQHAASFSPASYQDEESVLHEDHLLSALEEEFDLHLSEQQPAAPEQSFEFVEADRLEPVAQFDYDDYSRARTVYEEAHPDAYAASRPVEHLTNDAVAHHERAHQLSLEDELENLLFGEEPQPEFEPEPTYQPDYREETQQSEHDTLHFNDHVADNATYSEPSFDDFSLQDLQADMPVEAAASYAPESYASESYASETSPQAQPEAYPHYTLSNFAAGASTTAVLSSDAAHETGSAYETQNPEPESDFWAANADNFAISAAESADDDLSDLNEISLTEDDFGFEPSGDTPSFVAADASTDFNEEDFFTEDDFDLSSEGEAEQQSEPVYAHATYNDEGQDSAAPSFANYADQRSAFAAPAPEIETLSVADSKVEQTHSLDLPEVNYGDEDAGTSLNDLEAEFAEVFSTMDIEESNPQHEVQSEADKAFEDIFRESASSYLPNGGVAAGAALGLGAAAATVAYGRANPAVASVTPQNTAGSNDDYYNHWAAQGAQTMEGGEFGTRAAMQPEDDLGLAAEAYRNRPVRGRRGLILASVAGLAVLIGGIGYHFLGDSGSGEPVVIRAENQPIKVQPENPGGAVVPNQDKAVYERVTGTLPNNPEQKSLISAGEEPVDIGARDDDAGMNDSAETNHAASSDSGQNTPLIQPREVETMIVRPDGSIVQSQPPVQTTPQQVAPVSATNNDEPIAPPAETDEIAAIAAGNEPRQAVANNQPATQAPAVSVRAPVVPSRPAQQPTTIVGNVPQRTQLPAQASASQVASAAAGGYFIQIASQPSAELAQKSYANMAQRYGSVIGGRAVDIKRADIPNKGTYYRVRVQAGTKEEANALCGRFKSAGGSCFVTQ
ncbi:SPOR domain-containing protein [Brucella gallinifaecis]|uniref:SPOR domain-containing protein n=1 Tax=Brucella gallinifaecis TaxID=215590 RepID=A0A502BMU4_9HYPH|nr:SPOR domain-containing protein [Brucella gallinifaecis]TPF75147.1 SPOR domain-containing protein [Brucella gallinifaecis]